MDDDWPGIMLNDGSFKVIHDLKWMTEDYDRKSNVEHHGRGVLHINEKLGQSWPQKLTCSATNVTPQWLTIS